MGRTRKILVRIAVSGLALWVGRDAVSVLPVSSGEGSSSSVAQRIAVVIAHLKQAEPSRGVDGDGDATSDPDTFLPSPKRFSFDLDRTTVSGARVDFCCEAGLTDRRVDLRSRRALWSPPMRAPPLA